MTAIFNNESRNGLVVGSVEHDNWKTGISIGKGDRDNIGSLVCYGGIADEQTQMCIRDSHIPLLRDDHSPKAEISSIRQQVCHTIISYYLWLLLTASNY